MAAQAFLGTSGWTYPHWRSVFYPEGLAQKKWFEYFQTRFHTVELNASFYRVPTQAVVSGWNARSGEQFRFSVKMNRRITHLKRLHNCGPELDLFFKTFSPLKSKIAIFLVQVPSSVNFDIDRLSSFLELLPEDDQFAFEFRDSGWYREETYSLLRKTGRVFCIHDMRGSATEKIIIADIAYLRFHGFGTRYGGDYPDEDLHSWAAWIRKQIRAGVTVFGYFNNDVGGCAVKNCLTLREMVERS